MSATPLSPLMEQGFQFKFISHAQAILNVDFPDTLKELAEVLSETTIPITEIIGSGGGESKGTQRLRNALYEKTWLKKNFEIKKTINGKIRESISHEVDHVKEFASGHTLALEIEWNNKDPFFDRDLENFKRLHQEGAISAGIIVTRGASLQSGMKDLVRKFLSDNGITSLAPLANYGYTPTAKQRAEMERRMSRSDSPVDFETAFTDKFVSDKFGAATTHWSKLIDRVNRGVGNPCPLLLVGLPASIVTFEYLSH